MIEITTNKKKKHCYPEDWHLFHFTHETIHIFRFCTQTRVRIIDFYIQNYIDCSFACAHAYVVYAFFFHFTKIKQSSPSV